MIEINNLTVDRINMRFLSKVAKIVLIGENKKGADLSIALVGQRRIKNLNKKYRKKNQATDVLVFGQNQKFPITPKSGLDLGEVIICLREVKKNAKRFKSGFEKELARVLIHGILHLLGYSHKKSKIGAKEMEKRENYYLLKLASR
jgi:probable rRNA maturation factor